MIQLLDQHTINKIAAGEVVERPASVVKELVENAIDAKASAITVEIKEGGTQLIRITDNGIGISKEEVKAAFLRHSTSKIKSIEDLFTVASLGFRGEALASIASVAQVEMITKTRDDLTGIRYSIEGGQEDLFEEIGCPEGTTILIRNLFFNTPARRKFLKTPGTEAGYISELMNKLALSHPHISFKFINNNQVKLHTSGNNKLQDIIFNIYGKDVAKNLLPISYAKEGLIIEGFIGKPQVSRANRNYENYYINGRYIKSTLIQKALEEGYKTYLPLHKYPFCALHFQMDSNSIDVNVHPTKMEVRFSHHEMLFNLIKELVQETLRSTELIPEVGFDTVKTSKPVFSSSLPEPFEKTHHTNRKHEKEETPIIHKTVETLVEEPLEEIKSHKTQSSLQENGQTYKYKEVQQVEIEPIFLSEKALPFYQIIGQLFNTYWIVEFKEKFYLIDQHAAHERVLYEKIMQGIKESKRISQPLLQPLVVQVSLKEQEVVKKYKGVFEALGFDIESFGGDAYAIRAVPYILNDNLNEDYFLEMVDVLADENYSLGHELLVEKAASMACKAAVKAHDQMNFIESKKLIEQLLILENPYTCPHGRPTIITMTKYELEKKFKRIQ
jgi:DNA mismatch repair protein MutL